MQKDILTNLNPDQLKAVVYEKSPLLVLAGAGSGKTKVLTTRAAWFIQTGRAKSENVLLLTFTNKAANEMKERILSMIGDVPSYSGTFHSFCVRVLRRDGNKIGISPDFVIYDTQDQKAAVTEVIESIGLSPDSYKPAQFLPAISDAKNQMMTPLQYGEIANGEMQEKVFSVYNQYAKYLEKANALDFDDLLLRAVELFVRDNETLTKWQEQLTHILVDEWQDTNKIQYKLTRQLVGKTGNLTAVGDASQSIYSWRGADFRNINNLRSDYANIGVVNLEQNYRSTEQILEAANSVISKNSSHPILKLWTENGRGERIKIFGAQNGLDEAKYVSDKVRELSRQGYNFADMAILYRTNAQSRTIEEALLHTGVPYVIVGGIKFYERAEVKDILACLRLLANRNDGVSEKRVLTLGKRRWDKFVEYREGLEGGVENHTTLELMDAVVAKTNYLEKYARESEENLAKLENIKELRSVAMEFPVLHDFLENVALVQQEETVNEKSFGDNSREGRVTLMTLWFLVA